jgi:hypothetical protein
LDRGKKGAWIGSIRKSYAGYLIRRLGTESDLNLGFTDAQGKATYPFSEAHSIGASVIWGKSSLERNPANRGITSIIDGWNNVGVVNFSYTWAPGEKWYLESRLYAIRETFNNRNKEGALLDRGAYTEFALRSDLSWQVAPKHRLESGFLSRHTSSNVVDRRYNYSLQQFVDFDTASSRFWQNAAYIQDRWSIKDRSLTAIIGARLDSTGLTGQALAQPRASLEWRWGAGNRLDAGWGIFSQFPEVVPVLGRNGDPGLRAEIARNYVLGYERLLGRDARLRVEWFDREEADLQRNRDNLYRLNNGKVAAPNINFRYDNALRGYARGFEVFMQRRSANRLAGWISYSYMVAKRRDLVTGETYNSDFDQRHTVNLYGSYRFSESWNLSVKARLGSGFPYPGYLEKRGEDFYLTTVRNQERLPFYSRVDFRCSKAFYFKRGKLSLYVEVLNVSNRGNWRFDRISSVNAATLKVSMTRDSLLPILPTAGFMLEF